MFTPQIHMEGSYFQHVFLSNRLVQSNEYRFSMLKPTFAIWRTPCHLTLRSNPQGRTQGRTRRLRCCKKAVQPAVAVPEKLYEILESHQVHFRKLTWTRKNPIFESFQIILFRLHVSFRGCTVFDTPTSNIAPEN